MEFSDTFKFSAAKIARKSPETTENNDVSKKPLSNTFSVAGRQNSNAFMTPKGVFEFPKNKASQFDFSKNNYQNTTRIFSTQSMQLSDIGVVMKNQLS